MFDEILDLFDRGRRRTASSGLRGKLARAIGGEDERDERRGDDADDRANRRGWDDDDDRDDWRPRGRRGHTRDRFDID